MLQILLQTVAVSYSGTTDTAENIKNHLEELSEPYYLTGERDDNGRQENSGGIGGYVTVGDLQSIGLSEKVIFEL